MEQRSKEEIIYAIQTTQRRITGFLVRAPAFEFVCEKITTLCMCCLMRDASLCFIELKHEAHLFIEAVDVLIQQIEKRSTLDL